MEKIISDIRALLDEHLAGQDDMFVVDIVLSVGNQLQVFIDTDEGITLGQCKKVSRFLEGHLDENKWLTETYGIEVSSPGVGKPLKLERQYRKNIGRLLEVTLSDTGTKVKSRLLAVNGEGIVLQHEDKIKPEGAKKKVLTTITHEIPFVNIKNAVVQIEF